MRVFLTGATGFIGSRVLLDLLRAGHEVVGLARSDAGERILAAAGAAAYRGTLEEPEGVAAGAALADAVIHTAFDHDFSRFAENCAKDARLIEAIGRALAGRGQPFLVTSGVALGSDGAGAPAREDVVDWNSANPRIATERAGQAAAEAGASVAIVRLPQVHDTARQGLVTSLVDIARERGVSGYAGDGTTAWSAAHVDDVARLYVLALEKHAPGARHHAVAETGVPTREIAEEIGRGSGLPVASIEPCELAAHFGWLGAFMTHDMRASSDATRARLGWTPTGPGLLADLREMLQG